MKGVNRATIIGLLGKDPELRYTPAGKPVATFSIATTESWGTGDDKQERTEWHNIVAWGKLGEICHQYLKKGKPAYVEGRLATRSWDDKDGNKRYKTEIIASEVQFLGQREQGDGQQQRSTYQRPDEDNIPDTPEDDLPF